MSITFYVDGSWSSRRPDVAGWGYTDGGAVFDSGTVTGEAVSMRQVAGEITAVLYAVRRAIDLGCREVVICYDYIGVEMWATGRWQAKNRHTQEYVSQMARAAACISIVWKKVDASANKADALARIATGALYAH